MTRSARVAAVGQAAHACRLTIMGNISQIQSWSTSFWFDYSVGPTVPSAVTAAASLAGSDDLETYIEAFEGALNEYMSQATFCTTWKVSCWGESGTNPAEQYATHPAGIGGSSSHVLPSECALVASLLTAQSGASFRGRSYLPLTGLLMSNQGMASDSAASDVATAVASMLTSIKHHDFDQTDDLVFNLNPVVNSVALGLMTPITSVRVDTKVDAQRRREDKLIGAAHTAGVS